MSAEESAAGVRTQGSLRSAVPLSVLVAIELVFFLSLSNNAFFVVDDYLHLIRGKGPIEEANIFGSIFEHFIPGYMLVQWIVGHFFPLNQNIPLAVSLFLHALSTCVFYCLVRRILDQRAALILAALGGLSMMWLGPFVWWSAGLLYFPTLLLILFALLSYDRHIEEPRTAPLLLACLSTALATLFYEKAVFVPAFCLMIEIVRQRPLLGLRPALLRLTVVTAPVLVYLLVRSIIAPPPPSPPLEWALLVEAVGRGWLFGFPLYFLAFYHELPGIEWAVAASILVLLPIVLTLLCFRRAWMIWAIFFMVFFAGHTLIAISPAKLLGVGVCQDVRYNVEFAWFYPLTLAFATLLPLNGLSQKLQLWKKGRNSGEPRARVIKLIVAVTALFFIPRFWSVDNIPAGGLNLHNAVQVRRFVLNLQEDLNSAITPPKPLPLLEGVVPSYFKMGWLVPYDRLSLFTKIFELPLTFNLLGREREVFAVDRTGGLVRLAVKGRATLADRSCLTGERAFDLGVWQRQKALALVLEPSKAGTHLIAVSDSKASFHYKVDVSEPEIEKLVLPLSLEHPTEGLPLSALHVRVLEEPAPCSLKPSEFVKFRRLSGLK